MKKFFSNFFGFLLFCSISVFGQIVSQTSGNWSNPATWTGGVVPRAADNVIIADGDTVIIDAASISMNNLIVGQGNSGSLKFNTVNSSTMIVNGSITISPNAEFKVVSRPSSLNPDIVDTLYLNGDLTNNGTLDFRSGSANSSLVVCNLVLTGTTNSILTTPTIYGAQGDFNKLFIDKTGGAKVILGSDIFVNGGSSSSPASNSGIVFINGKVETGNFALVYLGSTEANISGYSDSSYVIGALGRGMSNSGSSSKNFPIGDNKSYELVNVHSTTSGSSTGHYVLVRCISGDANTGSSILSGGIDKVSQIRYYKIGYHGAPGTSPASTMGFDIFRASYNTDDGVNPGNTDLRIAISTDDRATWVAIPQNYVFTTQDTSLPGQLTDTLSKAITVNIGSDSIYIALARATGTTTNDLGNPTDAKQVSNKNLAIYNLSQNYPNPFNPTTEINFSIAKAGFVKLTVYNILGEKVKDLINGFMNAGSHSINFNASKLSSGIYLYTITTDNFVQTKKMVLLK